MKVIIRIKERGTTYLVAQAHVDCCRGPCVGSVRALSLRQRPQALLLSHGASCCHGGQSPRPPMCEGK